MTEQETREKIVGIISNDHCLFPRQIDCKGCKYEEMATDCDAFRLADALIAAGIGDVKETKFESDHYWRMWQGALVALSRTPRGSCGKRTKTL